MVVNDVNRHFQFGPFLLDSRERQLSREGEPIRLTPKAFDVLLVLVSRAGHLVTKEELLKEVWPDTFVEEGNLSYTVSLLRKALEVEPGTDTYIATVQKLGYRFTAPVRAAEESSETVSGPGHVAVEPQDVALESERHAPSRLTTRGWLATAAIGGVLVFAAFAFTKYLRQADHSRPLPPAKLEIVLPPNVEEGKEPSISPDGRFLVMTAIVHGRMQIVVRPMESTELRPVPGTDRGWMPFWSPDGQSLAFLQGRKLRRVELSGGEPTDICDVALLAGGDWSENGVILFGEEHGKVLYRAGANGGTRQAVTSLDASRGEVAHRWPSFLPDGHHFFYTVEGPEGGIYVGALDRSTQKRIVREGRVGRYVPPGYILFLRGQTLMAQRFDLRSLEPQSEPTPLVDGMGLGSMTGSGFSVSRDGTIVFRPAQPDPTQLVWYGRDGSRLATAGQPGSYRQVALSARGQQVAISRRDPATGNLNIYTLDLSTGVMSPQTTARSIDGDPRWSPDERTVLFTSNRTGWMRPFKKDLKTSKEDPLLDEASADVYVEDWTSDGRLIVLRSQDVWFAIAASGRGTPTRLAPRPPSGDQLRVSPTREWVAFESTESAQTEVYVATFPHFLERRKISLDGGTQPVWRRDGRELFYLSLKGALTAVDIAGGSRPTPLFTTPLQPTTGLDEYGTVDGQRFLFIEKKGQTVTILMNWIETRLR